MPKLLWVLLPLLLAAVLVALLAWRGRMPSRLALNVGFSLLLLTYLLTTAGLGIFWVANQQLPAFDWHYLFGYSVLLLLVVHLGFNLRVVLRQLRRRPPQDAATPRAAADRRPALGLLGVGAAAGIGYLVGLRHGRTELRLAGGAAGGATSAQALAVVDAFHAYSAHSRAGLLRRAPGADWGDAPPPFKPDAGGARVPLVKHAHGGRFDAAALGTLLWHTAGVNLRRGTIHFRSAPSAGALFATELYLALPALPGIAGGLWHYDAQAHALRQLGDALPDAASLGLPAPALDDALALVVASAVFRRSGHKYRDRTYRYVLADLGHALENLRLAAPALGARAELLRHFDEARAAAALGIDQAEEGVLAVALLRRADAPPWPAAATTTATADAAGWQSALAAGEHAAGALGVTDAVHRATSLRRVGTPTWPPSGWADRVTPAVTGGERRPLPPPRLAAVDPLAAIAARRSRRRYAPTLLPLADLSAVLAAMGQPAPLLSPAVRIDVLTPAVEGLRPAAWRYLPQPHALDLRRQHDDGLRLRARAVALAQDTIGDAAAVVVLSIARAAWTAEAAGAARGYRLAFLETGLVGERLYLEAAARRLGACAVGAFYDDEAAALVGVDPQHEAVVHFAALGVPA